MQHKGITRIIPGPGSQRKGEQIELLEAWRTRDLGQYRYIVLDAQHEKVRQGGQVLDAAVLIACGVGSDGKRDVLGCSVSLSEAEVHWRAFLSDLKDRGLHGIELVVRRRTCLRGLPCSTSR